ncbi:MAG: glycosyltransferase family 4 protein [Verrucomicrobiota bacterium]
MKKICFFFSTTDFTGAGKMGLEYAKAFRDAGYEVFAICGERIDAPTPSIVNYLIQEKIEVIEERGFTKLLDIFLILRCAIILKKRKPSAVISMFQMDVKIAGWAAFLAGVPLILSAQNRVKFYGNIFLQRMKDRFFGVTLRKTARLAICTSEAVEKELWEHYRFDRTRIVYNGIDTKTFSDFPTSERKKSREALGVSDSEKMFLNIGRLDEQKGQDILLRAWKEALNRMQSAKQNLENKSTNMPSLYPSGFPLKAGMTSADFGMKLFLAGGVTPHSKASEAYADRLRRLVEELGIERSVYFLGWRDDICELLRACDCYVHSALWEGWPLTVLEAMASNVPVIMTDCVERMKDFENERDGFVVPSGEVEPLARAIDRVSEMHIEDRSRMGQCAQKIIREHYEIAHLKRAFIEEVETVCG